MVCCLALLQMGWSDGALVPLKPKGLRRFDLDMRLRRHAYWQVLLPCERVFARGVKVFRMTCLKASINVCCSRARPLCTRWWLQLVCCVAPMHLLCGYTGVGRPDIDHSFLEDELHTDLDEKHVSPHDVVIHL